MAHKPITQVADAIKALEKAGTAQGRKIYARHGVGEKQFGVSTANLKALAKRIKTNHLLAEDLWMTGNHDARMLAALIADPSAVSARRLDLWAKDLDNYVLTDAFSQFAAQTPFVQAKAKVWSESQTEWIGRAGWNLVARLAMDDRDLGDDWFARQLKTIEKEIHGRKNRVKEAMNMALIAIGVRNDALTRLALEAAMRIGKVDVDHGETSCKTPDAAEYIEKTLAHRRKVQRA